MFVGNRVSEIKDLTEGKQWNYVSSKENPADVASRGVFPDSLLNCKLWWNGPSWLASSSTEWPPQSESVINIAELPDLRKKYVFVSIEILQFPFDTFSSLKRLNRTMAFILRFINNARQAKENRQFGCLTVDELTISMKKLVKIAQHDSFGEDVQILNSKQPFSRKSKLLSLSPFCDPDGLLRVGGRLKNSKLSYNARHPLLLSGSHYLTKLIFEDQHRKLFHAGPQLLLATVRQTYWATAGMNAAKRVTRNCIQCFKLRPTNVAPIMASLPKERVSEMHPFNVAGVDYAGPFYLKDKKGRGCKQIKGYICLFICFATKALHLELVTDLSSETFILALRRFTSRRGKPEKIFSDNGTNFVGAQNMLKELHDFLIKENNNIIDSCANECIAWHFIPPYSPHFGGLWESGVKSVKFHLLRVLKDSKLTYEEFYSILVQVEGMLNSRPLYPLSSDPNDLQPLTPSHFLIGRPLVTVADPSVQHLPMNRMSRFQFLQHLNQSFWKRWSTEYLSQLQQRGKWKQQVHAIKTGTLVVVKKDNFPSCRWSMGRIIDIHPDREGVVRVVTVKTSQGVFKRAVVNVCPLPMPECE